jgi:hypothetical protein
MHHVPCKEFTQTQFKFKTKFRKGENKKNRLEVKNTFGNQEITKCNTFQSVCVVDT